MFDVDAIRQGLEHDEFFLEYLPTVSLADQRCVGCEALIRWRRDGRVIPPLDFIPAIENTLLSGSVTYWVIDTVARELGGWLREHEDVHLSVNVPPSVLAHAGLVAAIANSNLLDVIGQLVVEVTERTVPKSINVIPLNNPANKRARIALDDTTLTEASLVTLSKTRVDIVKIDKPFIDQLLRADCPPQKLAALDKLLRAKRHILIAEGVETSEQAQRLTQLGVHMAQGWYFSQPVAAEDFMTYFAAHR